MNITLQRLYAALQRGTRHLDARQMQLRSGGDPGRWSIQQTIEHLAMTYSATSDNFKLRLEKGTATAAKTSQQQRVGQFVVCTLGLFPKGRKAPEIVMPKADEAPASGDEMLERVRGELERFDGLAMEAERIFGAERAITHPILGPMSVQDWRRFHLVHAEHHLRQISAILLSVPKHHSIAGSSGSTPSATGR